MMKTLLWMLKLLLFLAALTFAVKNTDVVTVHYYLGLQWQAPLIFVMLVVFCVGAVAGVLASLGPVVRLRRELSRLRKPVNAGAVTAVSAETVPPTQVADAR